MLNKTTRRALTAYTEKPHALTPADLDVLLNAANAAAGLALSERAADGAYTTPEIAGRHLTAVYRTAEREHFGILFLDTRHRLIHAETALFSGTLDGASVYPREVVKAALRHNAAAVILAHNHPSGVTEPSRADEHITRRLKDALALVDIRVLDHIITGQDEFASLANKGLL